MKKLPTRLLIILLMSYFSLPLAQGQKASASLSIQVTDARGQALPGVNLYLEPGGQRVETDSAGYFRWRNLAPGAYRLSAFLPGRQSRIDSVQVPEQGLALSWVLYEFSAMLAPVEVSYQRDSTFARRSLAAVEDFGLYHGKKTELVEIDALNVNLATNNARQAYAKISGLNIWESDGAGLQLGIGGRGLSPNRTANFNVRQNGYDISADALGYPESYYTPPLEAVERIELVRGAASLQYGTQFGGMLNFKMREGPTDRKLALRSRLSMGSWGFFNSFTSAGGTLAEGKLNYYTYFQYKGGDGFRQNSAFEAINAYGALQYRPQQNWEIRLEFGKMRYLAQQAGGLSDRLFVLDPRQSLRERNWFAVDWNMGAVVVNYKISTRSEINSRSFGLLAQRDAVGNLERINVADLGGERSLIRGQFRNIGNETRWLHRYRLWGQNQAFLLGTRLYRGNTRAGQGLANSGSGPSFRFLEPDNLENSDYRFSNDNVSLFLENIFQISKAWSLSPGLRWEYIGTGAEGYYNQRVFDGAGNLIAQNREDEKLGRQRRFAIVGLGSEYQFRPGLKLYANFSQNYRAINFSDIRVVNPNYRVDPDIQDESGYTLDLGLKLSQNNRFRMELTAFMVRYNNKIGQVLRADQPPLFLDYRFRGNISDARNWGLEFFGEINLAAYLLPKNSRLGWTLFVNSAWVDARYINTEDNSIRDKRVEMVPPFTLRSGSQWEYRGFQLNFQFSQLAEHFSDATNARLTATAVEGLIPSYQVADLSFRYCYRNYRFEASVNNLFDQMYFTRRAEGYPGPGIIPSDGRGFFLGLEARF